MARRAPRVPSAINPRPSATKLFLSQAPRRADGTHGRQPAWRAPRRSGGGRARSRDPSLVGLTAAAPVSASGASPGPRAFPPSDFGPRPATGGFLSCHHVCACFLLRTRPQAASHVAGEAPFATRPRAPAWEPHYGTAPRSAGVGSHVWRGHAPPALLRLPVAGQFSATPYCRQQCPQF
ncbi:MAG: hypothetical protein J3K34DRAFT_263081 [Monoraphidium minutum]|nr:MAG: hypothetical protein J3K34DRAFT_263081 [Monoraphidium minutum]